MTIVRGSANIYFIDLSSFIDITSHPQLVFGFISSIISIFITCTLLVLWNWKLKVYFCIKKSVNVFYLCLQVCLLDVSIY